MRIKTENGEVNVASQGQSTLNTVLGAVGAAGSMGVLSGLLGGNRNQPPQQEGDRPVTRYEMGLIRESIAKDNEIALLKSEKYTDEKVHDAERRQCEVNTQQAVYNGVNTATVQCLQKQINQLLGMTQMMIPNANVSPGWGGVTIEPTPVVKTAAAQGTNQQNG